MLWRCLPWQKNIWAQCMQSVRLHCVCFSLLLFLFPTRFLPRFHSRFSVSSSCWWRMAVAFNGRDLGCVRQLPLRWRRRRFFCVPPVSHSLRHGRFGRSCKSVGDLRLCVWCSRFCLLPFGTRTLSRYIGVRNTTIQPT